MRRLLVSLAILAALLVGADFGFRLYSESVVSGELKSALALSEKPSVSFGGWPFTTHVVSGEFPSASFSARTFSTHGVELREVRVTLDDVRFPRRRLISAGSGVIRASAGHGTVVLTAGDITAALKGVGAPFTVRIENGRASASAQGITVGLDLKVVRGSLVLTPAATTIGSTSVRLPSFIRGLRYTSLKLQGSEAVLTMSLRHPEFVVPR
jgi:hypothetical protein